MLFQAIGHLRLLTPRGLTSDLSIALLISMGNNLFYLIFRQGKVAVWIDTSNSIQGSFLVVNFFVLVWLVIVNKVVNSSLLQRRVSSFALCFFFLFFCV